MKIHIQKAVMGLWMLALSTTIWAESYMYLTNNTHQRLDIAIEQSGAPLVKGQHWRQHAASVPPFGTVRYMEVNRDTGIKRGKDYYFDTLVTAEDGSTVVLQQKLTGTWNFSKIWHGTQQSPWYRE